MKSASGERRCRFKCPFEPRVTTTIFDSGRRPLYRRRCRHSHLKKGVLMNDYWVAAYNGHLLQKYHVHINVEACTESSPVKYLIKYLTKGTVMSIVRAVNEDDGIPQYENTVYIGSIDSYWKLWSFPGHGQTPYVYRLNYHELGKQPFAWTRDISDVKFQHRLENTTSTLMTWFDYNREHADGWQRRLLYAEFPEHYTLLKTKRWSPRRKMKVIGRMYVSYPGQGARYYIRLLLCHQRGCTSWEDLQTFRGVLCENWQEAAQRLVLLDDGNHWMEMFIEVAPIRPRWVLRQLFVLALRQNVPNIDRLWKRFAQHM